MKTVTSKSYSLSKEVFGLRIVMKIIIIIIIIIMIIIIMIIIIMIMIIFISHSQIQDMIFAVALNDQTKEFNFQSSYVSE